MFMELVNWIRDNCEWVFSGIGTAIISLGVGSIVIYKINSSNKVSMKNVKAGNDVTGRDKNIKP